LRQSLQLLTLFFILLQSLLQLPLLLILLHILELLPLNVWSLLLAHARFFES
jgi:hypothetical protein